MCDYSISSCATRDAKVGDKLVSGHIINSYQNQTSTKGFTEPSVPDVAVCLRPGTELAFDEPIKYYKPGTWFQTEVTTGPSTAIFRETDVEKSYTHHDTLEFPDGEQVKVNLLVTGQNCRVLQLGVDPKMAHSEDQQVRQVPEEMMS